MTQFVDAADIVESLFESLVQFEPAPDALDLDATREGSVADDDPQWVVWEAAEAESEWAATELMSLMVMC